MRLTIVFFAALSLGTGCANLEAVRKFAKVSAGTDEFHDIVGDYASSTLRMIPYEPENQEATLRDQAKKREAQVKLLEDAQAVLAAYMSVLGDLAADDFPTVDDDVDALTKALGDSGILDDKTNKTIGAAGEIGKIVSRVVFEQWRQRKLVEVIREADPQVQALTAGLREILDTDLRAALKNERTAVDDLYHGVPDDHSDGDGQQARLAAMSYRMARLLRLQGDVDLDARIAKIDDYVAVLDAIAKGHADLAKNVDHLSAIDVVTRLNGYVRDIRALREQIAELN